MSDCLFLRAPHGLILPGCPDASAQKRGRMVTGETGHMPHDTSGGSCSPKQVLPDVAWPGDEMEEYGSDYAGRYTPPADWIDKVGLASFESLQLWESDEWLTSVQSVRNTLLLDQSHARHAPSRRL